MLLLLIMRSDGAFLIYKKYFYQILNIKKTLTKCKCCYVSQLNKNIEFSSVKELPENWNCQKVINIKKNIKINIVHYIRFL